MGISVPVTPLPVSNDTVAHNHAKHHQEQCKWTETVE